MLATIVIKSKIDGRTILLLLAGRKLKAKAKRKVQNRTLLPDTFTFQSCNFLFDICMRTSSKVSLVYDFYLSSIGISQAVSLEGM